MTAAPVITLVGCGKMGGALLRGWIASGIAQRFYVIEPSGLPAEFNTPSVEHVDQPPADSNLIVLAIKPQVMDAACAALTIPANALVLSIAAGRTIQSYENIFGPAQPIIRVMPNTPAAIGRGISVAVANRAASSPTHKALTETALAPTGQLEWIADESLMDAVTALSGSGPAYVFALIEAMAKAGEAVGLSPTLSMALARQTVIGSAALADHDATTPADTLRQAVTSPGGTTEAALNVLIGDNALQSLLRDAIKAARDRGRALSQN